MKLSPIAKPQERCCEDLTLSNWVRSHDPQKDAQSLVDGVTSTLKHEVAMVVIKPNFQTDNIKPQNAQT